MPQEEPDLTIRTMRPEEAETLVQLILDTFEHASLAKNITDRYGLINGHDWKERKGESAREDIKSADVVLVGEIDGAVAAMMTLSWDRKYATGHIPHLAVAKEFQGRGFGRRMIRAGLDMMRAEGLKYARIDALEQNERAVGLYTSEGFSEVGKKIHLFRPL